jgi:hypothetical protein
VKPIKKTQMWHPREHNVTENPAVGWTLNYEAEMLRIAKEQLKELKAIHDDLRKR